MQSVEAIRLMETRPDYQIAKSYANNETHDRLAKPMLQPSL